MQEFGNYLITEDIIIDNFMSTAAHAEWLGKSIADSVRKIKILFYDRPFGYFSYDKIFPVLYNMVASRKSLEITVEDTCRPQTYVLKIKKSLWTTVPKIEEHYKLNTYGSGINLDSGALVNPRIKELITFVADSLKIFANTIEDLLPNVTIERIDDSGPMRIIRADLRYDVRALDPVQIATEINKLPHLTSLNIYNGADDKLAAMLPILQQNTRLKSLHLRAKSAPVHKNLYNLMVQNTTLTELIVETYTDPTEVFLYDFLAHNRTLKNLQILDLAESWDTNKIAALVEQHPSLNSITIIPRYYNNRDPLYSVLTTKTAITSVQIFVSEFTQQFWHFLENSAHLIHLELDVPDQHTVEDQERIEQALLKLPYLESFNLVGDPFPLPNLAAHLAQNIRKRNEFQQHVVVLLFNLARSQIVLSVLPKELWCHIWKRVTYPTVPQDWGRILRLIQGQHGSESGPSLSNSVPAHDVIERNKIKYLLRSNQVNACNT